jgi:hypothetical protein
VANWAQFETEEPEMAALTRRLLENYRVAYIATVRPDGGPRIHPLTPVVLGDRLILGLMPATPKARDLRRDPRCSLHTLPGPHDAEICMAGRVERLSAAVVQDLVDTAPPHVRLAADTEIVELRIDRVSCTVFENRSDEKRPFPIRTRWVPSVPVA